MSPAINPTWMHRSFAHLKKWLPGWMTNPIRRVATAVLTPMLFSSRTGHFRSSLRAKAVGRDGDPLPWYSYPSIDFLKSRSFVDKTVLEFGAGQSTLWWAKRARRVVTFEDNQHWFDRVAQSMPGNVELYLVSGMTGAARAVEVARILGDTDGLFDVIIVDGLSRARMIGIATKYLSDDGMIVCDDAEIYGMHDAFTNSQLSRVDFCGFAPGVVLPRVTSTFFRPGSSFFGAEQPIAGCHGASVTRIS